jgi:hypothetical protein
VDKVACDWARLRWADNELILVLMMDAMTNSQNLGVAKKSLVL